jgi:glycerophosphoryl diester phosphodiesterase
MLLPKSMRLSLLLLTLIALLALYSCQRNKNVPVPDVKWALFDSAQPLTEASRKAMEGVYALKQGMEDLGPMAALKWTYTLKGKDTSYQLSFFCKEDASYFICEGKRLDSTILLKGIWRKMNLSETGTARFTINWKDGAGSLFEASADPITKKIIITGSYGIGDRQADRPFTAEYIRPLFTGNMEIIAHRGGGRVTDFIPATENSVPLILMSTSFGATGVEIDVQLTKDSIPILYHDEKIDDRLTQRDGIHSKIGHYTYAELSSVRLTKGEKIPTLREALEAIVSRTNLHFVWIDCKDETVLTTVRTLQQEFLQKAQAAGRKVEIVIGLHDQKSVERFVQFPDYKNIPALCELEPGDAKAIDADIWAPLWTEGLQKEEVTKVHQSGIKAFVWTIDKEKQITEFMMDGGYDGIVSNLPSLVAYFHYTRQ